jgi:hypothetical protein
LKSRGPRSQEHRSVVCRSGHLSYVKAARRNQAKLSLYRAADDCPLFRLRGPEFPWAIRASFSLCRVAVSSRIGRALLLLGKCQRAGAQFVALSGAATVLEWRVDRIDIGRARLDAADGVDRVSRQPVVCLRSSMRALARLAKTQLGNLARWSGCRRRGSKFPRRSTIICLCELAESA